MAVSVVYLENIWHQDALREEGKLEVWKIFGIKWKTDVLGGASKDLSHASGLRSGNVGMAVDDPCSDFNRWRARQVSVWLPSLGMN